MNGKCVTEKLPGLLQEMTNVDIPEYTFIAPDIKEIKVKWGEEYFTAECFIDLLEPLNESSQIEATFESSYYYGKNAIISKKLGRGKVYYYGSAWIE